MRLIDADALEKFLKRLRRELPKESRDFFTRDEMILNFQQYVHMQPTIDAVPVVRGGWVGFDYEYWGEAGTAYACSECDDKTTVKTNYCPNCGAKMEVEE